MPEKNQSVTAVSGQLDHDPPETYPDLASESAPGPVKGLAAKVPAAREVVVMSARRPWSIGQSIGLSSGYTFEPGKATEVTAEDARILCGREWDGRTFKRAAE